MKIEVVKNINDATGFYSLGEAYDANRDLANNGIKNTVASSHPSRPGFGVIVKLEIGASIQTAGFIRLIEGV